MADQIDRRSFLKISSASAAGAAMAGAGSAQQAAAPSRPIRLGFVGIGGRGSYHLDCALGMEGVVVKAVCDIDDNALFKAKRWVEEAGQPSPATYGDSRTAYQQLCEKEDLDCVICCTPWEYHTPCCVAAMKNGKNAVSEVPIVVTLEEAWELVETHEKTGKWATIGLEGFGDQQRHLPAHREIGRRWFRPRAVSRFHKGQVEERETLRYCIGFIGAGHERHPGEHQQMPSFHRSPSSELLFSSIARMPVPAKIPV